MRNPFEMMFVFFNTSNLYIFFCNITEARKSNAEKKIHLKGHVHPMFISVLFLWLFVGNYHAMIMHLLSPFLTKHREEKKATHSNANATHQFIRLIR